MENIGFIKTPKNIVTVLIKILPIILLVGIIIFNIIVLFLTTVYTNSPFAGLIALVLVVMVELAIIAILNEL